MCSLLNYMGLCPLPRKFLISKWWGFVHSRWYYLLFRCLFYTQKWCLWSSKTNIFLQNIMQPTYLFNRNKKRTLVAYTCKKDTKCHKYFQIADISAAVFLASECIMLLMSVAAWCPFANQLFTYFKGWKFSKGGPTSFKKSRLDKVVMYRELRADVRLTLQTRSFPPTPGRRAIAWSDWSHISHGHSILVLPDCQ